MKRFLAIACLLLSFAANAKERPTVAVVLSGGGAKGVAHIGALKVIEQAGIPIDIIVGTSMGAIVGGLYSIGYTPAQLDSIVLAQDWGLLLSDQTPRHNQTFTRKEQGDLYQVTYNFGRQLQGVGGMIRGTNLEMLFADLTAGHHDEMDFADLPIPFACVAADIVTGETMVLKHGVLTEAMRASMAIPGAFTPVYAGSRVLVDGGIVNNFPVDVAVGMGADIVIGVDVQTPLHGKERLVTAPEILGQIVEMSMQRENYQQNVARSDVYIKVDVEGYSAGSFNTAALDSLIRRGEKSARAKMYNLTALQGEVGRVACRGGFTPLSGRGAVRLYNVSIEGLTERQTRWVMRKCNMREHSLTDVRVLNHCVSVLSAATSHSGIYYSLRDTLDGYNLHFTMGEPRGNSLSAGVSFDTEEIASVLVNGTMRLGKNNKNQVASLTARFGKRMMVKGEYSLMTSPLSSFKWSYAWTRHNMTVNKGGKRDFNPLFNEYRAQLSYVNMNFLRQNLRMEMGLAYEEFHYLSWLTNYSDEMPIVTGDGYTIPLDRDHFITYFARLDYETLDSRYFTKRGTAVSINYDLYTDNFVQYKGLSPFWVLSGSWMTAIPVHDRLSIVPSVYGRLIWGTTVPFPKLNMIGGRFAGRYMPQQMPFDGVSYLETAPNAFMAVRLQARQQISRRNYLSASVNYGLAGNWFFDMAVDRRDYWGASLDWGYDLRNFPVQVSFGWSNVAKGPGLYIQAGFIF